VRAEPAERPGVAPAKAIFGRLTAANAAGFDRPESLRASTIQPYTLVASVHHAHVSSVARDPNRVVVDAVQRR